MAPNVEPFSIDNLRFILPDSPENNVSQASYLKSEIDGNILILKEKVKGLKRKTRVFNGMSIALGALITLTLGLELTGVAPIQKNIALVLGAILTFINGWNAFFDYKKLWFRQKTTLLDLYQVRNELGYRLCTQNNPDVDDIFERYLHIWEKDSTEWKGIIYKSQNDKKTNVVNLSDAQKQE